MKKLLFLLLLPILAVEMKLQSFDGFEDINVELRTGYCNDTFRNSSLATSTINGIRVPVPASLDVSRKFNNINIWTLGAQVEATTCNHIYFRVEGDYGWVNNGNEHFNVTTINPTTPVLDLSGSGRNGNSWDIEAVIGYEFSFCCREYYFTPLIGYKYTELNLRNNNFTGVPDSYTRNRARWSGPVFGFTAGWNYDCNWELYLGYEYQPLDFNNHYREFIPSSVIVSDYSSQQGARGNGNDVYLGVNYIFCSGFYTGLRFDYNYYCSNHGTERVIDFGGQPIRNIVWQSVCGKIVVGYAF